MRFFVDGWLALRGLAVAKAAVLALVVMANCSSFALAAGDEVATDVVPPLMSQSPSLRFHLGEAANNKPLLSKILLDMPYPPSPWYLAQWQQRSYIGPTLLARSDSTREAWRRDPRLGEPIYAFAAPDGHASLRIFGHEGAWIYELMEQGGALTGEGGSNVFLSADAIDPEARFDHTITYDVDLKLSRASDRYDTPSAKADGAVLSSSFTGFGLLYEDPKTHSRQFVFMQVPISSSRQLPGSPGYICSTIENLPHLLFRPTPTSLIPYRADDGVLHHQHHDLTAYVAALVSSPYPCGGRQIDWSADQKDLRNWRLTGLYIGLETEAEDHRKEAKIRTPQGSVETALQIANVRVQHWGVRPN